MKLIALSIISLILLLGCGNRPTHMDRAAENIMQISEGTYSVAYTGRSYTAVKKIVYDVATQYCQKKSEKMQIVNMGNNNTYQAYKTLLMPISTVELTFKCLLSSKADSTHPANSNNITGNWQSDDEMICFDSKTYVLWGNDGGVASGDYRISGGMLSMTVKDMGPDSIDVPYAVSSDSLTVFIPNEEPSIYSKTIARCPLPSAVSLSSSGTRSLPPR